MVTEQEILQALHSWQGFIQHPCWQDWRNALEIDLQTADDAVHKGDPRDPVSMAMFITQYEAIRNLLAYPMEQVSAFENALAKMKARQLDERKEE